MIQPGDLGRAAAAGQGHVGERIILGRLGAYYLGALVGAPDADEDAVVTQQQVLDDLQREGHPALAAVGALE